MSGIKELHKQLQPEAALVCIMQVSSVPILRFGNCNLSGDNCLLLHAISDLPAFLYKLISNEHALVIKEFPAWVEL